MIRQMEYVRLGWSGLKASKICLGAMSFGDPALQPFGGGGWVSGKEEAFKVLNRAWDLDKLLRHCQRVLEGKV